VLVLAEAVLPPGARRHPTQSLQFVRSLPLQRPYPLLQLFYFVHDVLKIGCLRRGESLRSSFAQRVLANVRPVQSLGSCGLLRAGTVTSCVNAREDDIIQHSFDVFVVHLKHHLPGARGVWYNNVNHVP